MPDYQIMTPLTAVENGALRESVKEHGVIVPIVFDEDGNCIDGHHRRLRERVVGEGVGLAGVVDNNNGRRRLK